MCFLRSIAQWKKNSAVARKKIRNYLTNFHMSFRQRTTESNFTAFTLKIILFRLCLGHRFYPLVADEHCVGSFAVMTSFVNFDYISWAFTCWQRRATACLTSSGVFVIVCSGTNVVSEFRHLWCFN